jgi:hypothetical protein
MRPLGSRPRKAEGGSPFGIVTFAIYLTTGLLVNGMSTKVYMIRWPPEP